MRSGFFAAVAIVVAFCGAATPAFSQITLPGDAPTGGLGEPAASARFEPETGRVGRPVVYRVTITAAQKPLEPPEPPTPTGVEVAFAGGTVSTVILNGMPAITSTFNYSVVGQRAGKFTMPAYEVAVAGKRVRVPPAVLTLAEPEAGEAPYQPVRVELDLPQRDFFVGESIGGRLLVIETQDESPQFVSHVAKTTTGVAVFRTSLRTTREQFTFRGKQFEGLVMPVRITPILEGDLELGCQVVVRVQKFELPGQRGMGGAQSTIDSKPARVRVLALPRTGRLPGFTGAIGKFTIAQPKLSATEVEAGEPVTLTLGMAGEGNLEGVAAPEMESGGGWQVYKPTSEYQADPEDHNTARGAKAFTYTLIPNRAGLKSTPVLPFSYFDPERRAYVDITVPPLPIHVKASSVALAPAPEETVKNDTPRAEEPPRTVEPAMTGLEEKPGRWTHSAGPPFRERWVLVLELAPAVLLLALWAWRRRREYLAANPQIIRRRRAHAAARRALARARAAARKGDRGEFLRASAGALREAASPLDTAHADSLTREDVLRLLGNDAGASAVARKVLDSADAVNYSTADAGSMEPRALLPELERAVHTLARRA